MQVDVIVHCAANTGFHVPLDEIMTTNVGGFMEVLNIAAGCKRLQVPLPSTAIGCFHPCMRCTLPHCSPRSMQQGDACCVARTGDAAGHSCCQCCHISISADETLLACRSDPPASHQPFV